MIPSKRQDFNSRFTTAKYAAFLQNLKDGWGDIPFRVAETPVFIPGDLKEKLIRAGEEIISVIRQDNFKSLTDRAIPAQWNVPGDEKHPHFLTFDFGICESPDGSLKPMLIELQGFPSLYGFQSYLAKTYIESYDLDSALTPYFGGLNEQQYIALLKDVLIGDHSPEEVALMDIDAPNQKTAIDFYVTQKLTGIQVLALADIKQEGRKLFYHKDGKKIQLKRIYNRLIFDEIGNDTAIFEDSFDPRTPLDVEWVTHPNWFYRISKFTMPFLESDFVPATYFVSELTTIPANLENYVLKPLFSFAGQGVIIDVTPEDINSVKDPENWILQKKVIYAPLIEAPDGGVKAELRLMYLWPEGGEPQLCINLMRLSRGKMIGVRYNADFDWVGGTVGLIG